ncbi:aminoglycoside phosphotransferase family protein [Streptomyces sp. NPDC050617]|uniref:aminoglycoside phosphotransferase family protein n=1 Tax=Streptomyces sp. NPDC050617 TaxID=3154628 RepID=UPI00342D9615
MTTSQGLEIPARLAASYDRAFGAEGRAWTAALPELVSRHLDRWGLVRDGAAGAGEASLVLPVRRADGTRAVLKLQPPRQETTAALIGLRAWDGAGAVRLLDHDPESSTMLLERLDGARTLAALEDDDEATAILAGLLARLVSVPAPAGLRGLGEVTAEMLARAPDAAAALIDPSERRLLRGWASAVAELADEPGDRLLHWDLHYGNVLAADREPWLAIDPEPLSGDPGFDLWPALDSRWDDVVAKGDALRIVRRRFDTLTEALALDRPRATAWTLARLLQNELWNVEDGARSLAPSSVAIAESLHNRRAN